MATIRTAIQIYDGMSPALRSMNNALNIVLNSFEAVHGASGNAINTSSIQAARQELAKAEVSFNKIEKAIRQSDQAQKQLNNDIRGGKGETDGLLDKVKNLVGAYIGIQTIKAGIELVDNNSNQLARLNLINDGLQTQEQLQQKVFQAAQNSRAAYGDTASAVAKLGITAKSSFSGNGEIIKFTELMNKSFKVGGASAQEQAAGMYQLTQAMASGRLQGDEYRSIIENAPLLAKSIENYMRNVKGATGSMKDWSADGQLTASVIKAALFNAGDEIEEKYKAMPITFADAWIRIQNRLIMSFQPLIQAIAKGAQFIDENWSTLEPIFYGLAAAVLWYALALGIQTLATLIATAAAEGFFAVLLANPLFWIALAIGAIVVLIYK